MIDTRPLPESVAGHAMLGPYVHSDGRACHYHHRLGTWAVGDRQCLRTHPDPARWMVRPTLTYFDAESAYGMVIRALCINEQCLGYMQEQEYRSDACPSCGVCG